MTLNIKPPRNGVRYKLIVYMRVSKDDAVTGSHTFETQKKRIVEFIDRRYGLNNCVIEEFRDDGVSGGYGPESTGVEKRVRQSIRDISERLKSGAYDGLVVYDLSRFMRSLRWLLQLIEDVIVPCGVDFASATENIDLSTPEGMAKVQMMGLFNNWQRSAIKARCKDATATRFEQGYVVGQPQYGWQWAPVEDSSPNARRLIVRNEEAGIWVVKIKDLYLSGWSTGRIACELNDLGVTSPGGLSRWTQGTVREVLSSPLHAGLVRYRDREQQGKHYEQRYYEPEVYHALVEARDKRRRWHTTTENVTVHLLNDLVFCDRCGKRLYTSRAQKEYRAYRCLNGQKHGRRTCKEVVVRAAPLERAVETEIARITELPAMRELLQAEARLACVKEDEGLMNERDQLKTSLAELDCQFKRWADMAIRNVISEDQFSDYNRELQTSRSDKMKRLVQIETALERSESREAIVQKVEAAILDFPRVWRHLNIEERRNVLSLLLEKLTVNRQVRDITLNIKLYLLPESEVRLMIPTGYRKKPEGIGPETLTFRHLAFLYHIDHGKSVAETCSAMGIAEGTGSFNVAEIRKRMGVHSIQECAAQARSRIRSLLPSIPLGCHRPRVKDAGICLTSKQMEIFPLLASGATTNEVASLLSLPATTVANRKKDILKRLQAKTIFEAQSKAKELGLLTA